MSTIATLRTNLVAAVTAIVPAGTDVFEARVPAASFSVAIRQPAVVISYAGKPKREAGPVGNRGRQGYVYAFTIAVVESNWQTPAGAAYLAADLAELLLGSPALPPATDNLRTLSLGTINDEEVFLKFVSESLEVDPGSTAQGGKFAIVQQWETNEVRC
jgi:hypothetical protein